jgi:glycopeptide antibiotics resistance protein
MGKRMQKNIANHNKIFNLLLYISFFTFVVLLIWGIYFKANQYSSVIKNYKRNLHRDLWGRFTYNLIPFDKLAKTPKSVIKDFILNTIAFLPFGIYLPLLNKKHSLFKGALFCFCFSLCFELAQLFTRVGSFSSNDLIANTLGYFLGVLMFNLTKGKLSKRLIAVVNAIIIIAVVPFLIYEFSDTFSHLSVYLYKTL